MSTFGKSLTWISDVMQILVLDRFNPNRKRASEIASTACRSVKFHAHCKIPQIEWRVLLESIGSGDINDVKLPGPATDIGDVGSQTGYHAIATLVKALQPRTVLEFGTYLGVSAFTIALNATSDCHIFTVDLPEATCFSAESGLNAIDQTHVIKSRHRVGEAFLRSPFKKQITQIRADSLAFRAETLVANVDLAYVDGGHSLACITKDTENAFRVLAPNGSILWDDYFHLYPDVVSFLDNLRCDYPLHRIPGTNYVFYSRRWKPTSL
jgi:predicted O-methyltransferase YrrM